MIELINYYILKLKLKEISIVQIIVTARGYFGKTYNCKLDNEWYFFADGRSCFGPILYRGWRWS